MTTLPESAAIGLGDRVHDLAGSPDSADVDAVPRYPWKWRTGPFTLGIPAGVFRPSSTSVVLAGALEIRPGDTVLDVGCGSGVLALVAARLGAARAIGCDASAAAVACARDNARELGLADVTEFHAGHLLDPVTDVRADVVIADVSGAMDAVAAATGWFPDGRGGGPTGSELPVALLDQLAQRLDATARVYLPTGNLQAEERVLAAARRVFGDNMQPVAERHFPLPQAVSQDPRVARLIDEGILTLTKRGSRYMWRLTIWCCQATGESTVALPKGRRSLTGLFLGARRLVAPGHGQFR